MNYNTILGFIIMLIGSGLGVVGAYYIQKGRTELAFKNTENIIQHINSSDEKIRTKILNNLEINKNEIVTLVNRQTKSSASEIITEVQDKFGLIEQDLNQKEIDIGIINNRLNPSTIAKEELGMFLDAIKADPTNAINYFPKILKINLPSNKYEPIISAILSIPINHSQRSVKSITNLLFYLAQEHPKKLGNDERLNDVTGYITLNEFPKESRLPLILGYYNKFRKNNTNENKFSFYLLFDQDLEKHYSLILSELKTTNEKNILKEVTLNMYRIKTEEEILPVVTSDHKKGVFFKQLLKTTY